MRKTFWISILPVILALGAGFLIGTRHRPHLPKHEAKRPASQEPVTDCVRVATLQVEKIKTPHYIETTGTIKPSLTADLAPKVMSRVTSVLVREGDHVRAGQVLVRLDSADLSAQARQAAAALASARAALAQAQTGALIQKTQSSTRLEQAKAALQQAEQQLSLVREGARPQQKHQADAGVLQAEAAKGQAEEGVKQARAGLAAAQAQLSLVREGARLQQKMQADAGLLQAEANLRTAQATYDRFKPLADDGVISKQRFDEIALQLEIARSQHETARQQASLVHEGARIQEVRQAEEGVRQAEAVVRMAEQKSREAEAAVKAAIAQRDMTYEGARSQELRQVEEQVRQAKESLRMARATMNENRIKIENVRMLRAQVTQAEANLAAARIQLGYATIVAPFTGVVIRRNIDPGAMALPGVPILTIVDASGFRLEAVVPESHIEEMHLGGEAQVTVDALSKTLSGRIAQIVPNTDPSSRTFILKIGLPGGSGLSSGMFGRARIVAGKTQKLLVPEKAIWRRESLTGVFVVEDGIAWKRLITVGKKEDGKVEVLSGLKGGETVVSDRLERVRDGARVEVAR